MTLIGGVAIAWAIVAYAQPSHLPLKRIGVVTQYGCPIQPNDPIRLRLAELGWIDGQTFVYDCASSVGRLNQVPALARELVSRHPDVLYATPIEFIRALQQETTTIPIVMTATAEPVRMGFITNLARPEGNVTGFAWFGPEVIPKRVELLKEIVPRLKRLAIISSVFADPKRTEIVEEYITIAAKKLDFTWQYFRATTATDYDGIFARLAAENFDAAYLIGEPTKTDCASLNLLQVI